MNHNDLITLAHERNAERYFPLYLTFNPKQQRGRPSITRTVSSATIHPEPGFSISPLASAKVSYALRHAWADSTIKKYNSGIKLFIDFCNRERIPISHRLPASEFLLCAFAASDAGILAGTTAQNRISAVRAWHIACDASWNGSLRLNYVLNGVENLTPTSSRKRPRPPITRAMLELLDVDLNHTDTLDVCVLAAAKAAFWGQCRLGEILSPTATRLPGAAERSLTRRSDLQSPCTSAGSRMLHLAHTKKCGKLGEDIILCKQCGRSDAISAIDEHLALNIFSDSSPIFSYHTASGERFLTRAKFLERCNAVWAIHGLPSSTGHSFRIGGTTELLMSSVPPDIVKTMGRWTSDSFLRYWRSLEVVVPLHAELLRSRVPM
jgi:hypothetical protein